MKKQAVHVVLIRLTPKVFALMSAATLLLTGCSRSGDQGRLVTTAEVQRQQEATVTRIQNDSSLSEKNKASMLKARAQAMQRASNATHPPPPPRR